MSASPIRALGVRADTSSLSFAVVTGTLSAPIIEAQGREHAPKVAVTEAQVLFWVVRKASDLLRSHQPTHVFIKAAESAGPSKRASAAKRSRLEGAFVGALGEVKPVVEFLTWASISPAIKATKTAKGKNKASAKHHMNDDIRGVDLRHYDDNIQEAILAATAALA